MRPITSYLVLIATTLFLTMSVFSQTTVDSRNEFRLGLKAGINQSSMFDETNENFNPSPKIGLAAGGFLSIPIGKFLGVQPEVMYSEKGYKAYGNNYEYTRTTSHLDVPLLVQLKPFEKFYIVGGPMYSYTLNKRDKITSGGFSTEQLQEYDNENIMKNTAAVMGGFDVNFGHVIISGRASWDLFNNNGDGTTTSPRYKNFFTQATIGFKF